MRGFWRRGWKDSVYRARNERERGGKGGAGAVGASVRQAAAADGGTRDASARGPAEERVAGPRHTEAQLTDAESRQRAYYEHTAHEYDAAHGEGSEHNLALAHVVRYLEWVGAKSVLDTGCGTGRALRYLQRGLPHLRLRGNDPSSALLDVAVERGVPREWLDVCGSERLPYANESFDAVVAFGVMHHVAKPELIVAEMLRVARLAVFISDGNIYGQGSMPTRLVKAVLGRTGLREPVNWVRRGGKLWYESDGDGVAWSYSIFDSLPMLIEACEYVFVVPTDGDRQAGGSPFLRARHGLASGFKNRPPV
jgi:SAM-dependent methyltransferase